MEIKFWEDNEILFITWKKRINRKALRGVGEVLHSLYTLKIYPSISLSIKTAC